MRDITLEETCYFNFTTRAFTTGVPTVLAGTPVLSVLESNNATPITAGVSVSVDRASVVGLNQATVVATAANGYEAGKSYAVYISTGTVGGVSVVGEVVAQFTVQSAAAFTRLGAPAGASVSADVAAMKVDTAAILVDTGTTLDGRIPAALVGGRMDASVGAMAANTLTAAATHADFGTELATAIWTDTTAGDFTVALSVGKSVMNGVSLGTGLTVAAVSGAVGSVTGNVGGNVTGSVGSVAAGGIAATSFAAGAIDAAAIATDAIGSDEISAAAVTKIQAGLATPTNITAGVITTVTNLTNAPTAGDLTATMKASVNAEALDVLNTDTFAEPGQGAPAATTTLAAKINYLYKAFRNKATQTSTTWSLYNDGGTVVDQKGTVSDDGTTFTKPQVATGP